MLNALKIVFGTKRGWQRLSLHTFACFGVVSAIIGFVVAVYVPSHSLGGHPLAIVLITAALSVLYGIFRAWPRGKISRTFTDNDITINVVVGDILSDKGQIVVGFSDTFDTDTTDDKVISSNSLQGQLLLHRFNNDVGLLNSKIDKGLKFVKPYVTEKRKDKALGKLARYSIGTVSVISDSTNSRIYCLAYSKMKNDLVAESTVHNLWEAVGQLWDAVYVNGQRKPVAMPLIGTGLARINALDRESLLRMTLLSFAARSREKLVCNELTVYIHPSDRDKINMLELEAFLKNL